jgi:YesN/AraC family two-component response regulator
MLCKTIDWEDNDITVSGVASNGLEAIQLIEKDVPDILLTDIRMPLMDGFRLILAIKDKYPKIKYIILTAHSDFNYAQNSIKLGVVDFILKPIDEEELMNAVKKAAKLVYEDNDRERKNQLVQSIMEDKLPNIKRGDNINIDSNLKNAKIIETAMEYIKNNIHTDITLNDVAEHVHFNSKYINVLFKKTVGESISKYIIKCKMELAVKLLKDPNIKVYEVCEKVGYKDQNHFRNIFTDFFKVSPSEYRKSRLL